MIRTNIILVKQEFAIIPSTFSPNQLDTAVLDMIDEETKEAYSYGPVTDVVWTTTPFNWENEARDWDFDQTTAQDGWYYTVSEDGNYLIVTLLSKVGLREGARYSFEIKNDDTVIYRDSMFVTSKGSKVEVYSYPNNYVISSQNTGYTVL